MRFLVEFTLCNLKNLSQILREIPLKLSKWQILKIDLVELGISIFECQIGR